MNRAVTILLGFLTIGLVALTSCKKDDKEPQKNEGTTYVSVAINLQSSLRAGTGTTDDEFNLKGTWNGKDAIETVAVYVVGDGSVSYGPVSYTHLSKYHSYPPVFLYYTKRDITNSWPDNFQYFSLLLFW